MINDFRIIQRKIGGQVFYQVHRVFYSNGVPVLIEPRPATLIGNKAQVILEDIDAILDALEKPTIVIPEWDRELKRS